MKKALRSSLCAILLLSLLSGMLLACGETPTESTETTAAVAETTAAVAETENPYDENGYLKDNMGTFDYGGKEFTLFYWSDREHEEFYAEEQTGEPVNDAIFQRNLNVEQRCNIKLCFDSEKGNASNIATYTQKLESNIKSGDTAYDMIGVYSITAGNCAVKGLLYDLNTCSGFEWDMPWWPENLMKQAVINDKLYFASGDISANVIYIMYVSFFNKEIIENRNLENPYDLVKNGTWTIDKMIEMSQGIYEDTDNSGTASIGDMYGTYCYTLHLDALFAGAGFTFITSENGELSINSEFYGDRAIDLVDKLSAFFKDNGSAYLLTENSNTSQWFAKGLSLFWTDRCRNAVNFKDQETPFGVLPVPKATAEQEKYYTVIGNPFSIYGLPCNTKDEAYASSVMEIYASESYRTISPVLYETTMKYRYTDDATSAEMFDIARSSVIFDLGRIFASAFNTPYNVLQSAIKSNVSWKTMTSTYTKKMWPASLKKMLSSFE